MFRISQPEQLLTEAMNDLENDWKIARMNWRDTARENFEKDFLEEIRPELRTAASACLELTHLLRRAVRECS